METNFGSGKAHRQEANAELEARIVSCALAFRIRTTALEAFDMAAKARR